MRLYGVKRQCHGAYQIIIDTVIYASMNGSVPEPGSFKIVLFSTVALMSGYHTVRMMNLELKYLPLAFVCLASSRFHSYLSVY